MAILFTIERKDRDFNARADGGDLFYIGKQTAYHDKSANEDFQGLFNVPLSKLPKLLYSADDSRGQYGFWADFIAPTARCEGGNFLTLNTYDRAKFTWGFGQFGAHVPDGDFILFFRDLLQQPEANDYFPDLSLSNGRIVKANTPMETAQSTQPLMDYLNPTTAAIEDAEVIAAAKLIHWTTRSAGARALQVSQMADTFKRLLRESDNRLGLDGQTADICLAICDIRHQGRATYATMMTALKSSKPIDALLDIGKLSYPDRIKTLKAEVASRKDLLLGKKWSRAKLDFV